VTEHDLWNMTEGLRTGWYTTRELYNRYLGWAKREGRTPPMHINTFSQVLGRCVLQKRQTKAGMTWLIFETDRSPLSS
jgi:phage/plasmid-associated DNA primase